MKNYTPSSYSSLLGIRNSTKDNYTKDRKKHTKNHEENAVIN